MKSLLLVQFLMLSAAVNAQPGDISYPPKTYYYTILDESGEPIQFIGNTEYSITVANIEYLPDNIPMLPKTNRFKSQDFHYTNQNSIYVT